MLQNFQKSKFDKRRVHDLLLEPANKSEVKEEILLSEGSIETNDNDI
jgi:hypothetical protein